MGVSNGDVTDDATWPPKVLWGSTVGYATDSLASCWILSRGRLTKLSMGLFMDNFVRWPWTSSSLLVWPRPV